MAPSRQPPAAPTPTLETFRFVRHHEAILYCQLGWCPTPILDGTLHGLYSVAMEWQCACKIRNLKSPPDKR